jgi:large subunit ribosomal protein L4
METTLFSDKLTKKTAIGLIHRLYITQLKNSQIHTASTKTKSEVRGGGRKPRPQKGQGYARSGSIRSPLWVGGGVIFGPKPHTVKRKINKKEKRLAILSAFFLKKNECFLTNEFENSDLTKTKNVINFFTKAGINLKEKKVLCILEKPNRSLWLASRNIKNVKLITAECLNVHVLLWSNHILISKEARNLIEFNYQKNYE